MVSPADHPFVQYTVARNRRVASRPRLYRYFRVADHAQDWIDGREVPLFAASTYLAKERHGTQTPDENLVHLSNTDLTIGNALLAPLERGVANVRNFAMVDCKVNGNPVPDTFGSFYVEDGIALSFCLANSRSIAERFGKLVCVEIFRIDDLKDALDLQLGSAGRIDRCQYTDDWTRTHFIKHVEDAWQQEFRIFWPGKAGQSVRIPTGHAEIVELLP